jgi:hypothetical protein
LKKREDDQSKLQYEESSNVDLPTRKAEGRQADRARTLSRSMFPCLSRMRYREVREIRNEEAPAMIHKRMIENDRDYLQGASRPEQRRGASCEHVRSLVD